MSREVFGVGMSGGGFVWGKFFRVNFSRKKFPEGGGIVKGAQPYPHAQLGVQISTCSSNIWAILVNTQTDSI